jgi:RNA polymerase sigma-70 factor (ECF subfamily)
MYSTCENLLTDARSGSGPAWERMVELYQPLVFGWLRRQGVGHHDAEELTQDVLSVVAQEMPQFEHNGRPGGFRRWLRQITVHRALGFFRAGKLRAAAVGGSEFRDQLAELGRDDSRLSHQWDREHDAQIVRQLLVRMASCFEEVTLSAFRHLVLDEMPAADVARQLGISVGAVYTAKSRVLRRLREEANGLVDDALLG